MKLCHGNSMFNFIVVPFIARSIVSFEWPILNGFFHGEMVDEHNKPNALAAFLTLVHTLITI